MGTVVWIVWCGYCKPFPLHEKYFSREGQDRAGQGREGKPQSAAGKTMVLDADRGPTPGLLEEKHFSRG